MSGYVHMFDQDEPTQDASQRVTFTDTFCPVVSEMANGDRLLVNYA